MNAVNLSKDTLSNIYSFCKNDRNYAILCNFVLFAIILLLSTIRYDTNDDLGMIILESGNGNGLEPSEFVIFSNVILGSVLKNLNMLNRDIPWHTLYILISIFVSYTILFYVFIKKYNLYLGTLLYVFLFFFYGLECITYIQFTKTASVLAIAAYFLLLYDFRQENKTAFYQLNLRHLIVIFLLAFSSLIRFDSVLLITLLCSPIFLYILVLNRLSFARYTIVTTIAMVFIFGLHIYNNNEYKKWGNFMEYNQARADIVDYKLFDKISEKNKTEILSKVGWTELELENINFWIFCDKDVYSLEKLKQISSYSREKMFASENFGANIKNSISEILYGGIVKKTTLILFFVLLITFISSNKGWTSVYIGVVISINFFLIFLITFIFKMPPNRVLDGMFLAIIVFVFIASDKLIIPKINKIWILGTLLLLISYKSYSDVYMHSKLNRKNRNSYNEMVAWLEQNATKYTYLSHIGGTCNEEISIFSNAKHLKNICIISLGTLQNSPTYEAALQKHNIQDGKLLKYINNDKFVMIYRDKRPENFETNHPALNDICSFIKVHYGIDGQFHEIKTFHVGKNTVRAVQFREKK